jgi:predicted DNA-binding protein
MDKQLKLINTGIRLTTEQKHKLEALAKQLGTSANNVVCQLIDGAQIEPVQKLEAVTRLRKG